MLAISQDELGGPEVLKATTVPQPDPGVGEILVRVRAAGVESHRRHKPADRTIGRPTAIHPRVGCVGHRGSCRTGRDALSAR